jgi:glutamate 5-kinase
VSAGRARLGGHAQEPKVKVVAKVGTSSITDAQGEIVVDAVAKFCREVALLHQAGHEVVVVTSGAIGEIGTSCPPGVWIFKSRSRSARARSSLLTWGMTL